MLNQVIQAMLYRGLHHQHYDRSSRSQGAPSLEASGVAPRSYFATGLILSIVPHRSSSDSSSSQLGRMQRSLLRLHGPRSTFAARLDERSASARCKWTSTSGLYTYLRLTIDLCAVKHWVWQLRCKFDSFGSTPGLLPSAHPRPDPCHTLTSSLPFFPYPLVLDAQTAS